MNLNFSFIIPVYNRPEEIAELLESLSLQEDKDFEVVIVEDGSDNNATNIVADYSAKLEIQYFFKENTGAGLSRNFGMEKAKGNYFIILDSDCLVPPHYLKAVRRSLSQHFSDAYGGADAAHSSFSPLQKAISYSMTSFLTTGGIRGKKNAVGKFQPRSFNFGLSKKAFDKSGGFNAMKIGEDIDLTFRLWELGFETIFLEKAFVYHKRRSSFQAFFKQTFAFGKGRPLLNRRYPKTKKITYWFPTVFMLGSLFSILMYGLGYPLFLMLVGLYLLAILVDSSIQNKSVHVGILSVLTTCTQFIGYGSGFLKAYFF